MAVAAEAAAAAEAALRAKAAALRIEAKAALGIPDRDEGFDEWLRRTLATAAAQIERLAPAAPEDTKNEAAILFAGYMFSHGWVEGLPTAGAPNVMRHSGAFSIIAPYRVHRAGSCRPA